MVSVAPNYATLKNGGVRTKIHISQQQLILEYLTWYQTNSWAYQFYLVVRFISKVFFNIHEYGYKLICISNYQQNCYL